MKNGFISTSNSQPLLHSGESLGQVLGHQALVVCVNIKLHRDLQESHGVC